MVGQLAFVGLEQTPRPMIRSPHHDEAIDATNQERSDPMAFLALRKRHAASASVSLRQPCPSYLLSLRSTAPLFEQMSEPPSE